MLEYAGERIDTKGIEEEENKEEGKYAHEEYMLQSWSKSVVIDASGPEGGNAKYVNHSCDPNCEYVTEALSGSDGEMVEVIFVKAKRDLVMFEELTAKYNWDVASKDVVIVCECRSKNCLQYIRKVDKKSINVQRKSRK